MLTPLHIRINIFMHTFMLHHVALPYTHMHMYNNTPVCISTHALCIRLHIILQCIYAYSQVYICSYYYVYIPLNFNVLQETRRRQSSRFVVIGVDIQFIFSPCHSHIKQASFILQISTAISYIRDNRVNAINNKNVSPFKPF